ncbi:23 kDa integral membrane protein-like isoform X2 [Xiphophorus couchianus]|uniref:23 kDa integral membrane protein-like isoform X2 n=1 Tax=Xiphophorus couchianus TaxID=32473 RepID=UPI00101660A9|nr:23 kDa integral membrane protein-like isoform X2 [Xiphophorus couchianus]
MGKINGCLKAVFISFNCLFAMKGIDAPSVMWLWVFAVITLLISLLGSHAARTENKCGLKLFAVLMGLGMVLMLVFGVAVVVLRKQEMENLRGPKVAQEFLKDNEKKHLLETLQEHLHCCGWSGVEDWGSDVPKSCRCTPSYEECKYNPQGSIGPSSVYSKSCGEIVGDYVEYAVKIGLCIIFGFAFVAVSSDHILCHHLQTIFTAQQHKSFNPGEGRQKSFGPKFLHFHCEN